MPTHRPAPLPRGTGTVLVVDYDDGVRNVVRRVLERAGYAVLDARDAAAALRHAQGNRPIHLLLTDLRLPDADGRDLAARVVCLTGARVLYTSAYPFGVIAVDRWSDHTPFLAKPFTASTLSIAVSDVLRDSAA